MIAMSGTRLLSPVAVTSSRVPAIVCVIVACCACAAAGIAAAQSISAPNMLLIAPSLLFVTMAQRIARGAWPGAERRRLGSPAGDQAIDEQQNEGADDSGD